METKKILSPFSRVLSMILSMLIIFYMVPITVSAKEADEESLPSGEAAETVDTAIADDVRSKNSEIYEVVDLREANAKHFRLADGSYALAHYDYPVHYIDEYGDYVDIDNRLSDSGSEFSTENARVKFIKKITGNGNIFTLHENNAKITMGLVGAEKKTAGVVTSVGNSDDYIEDALGKLTNLENISSTIRYSDILDGVDIEYIVHSLNIKENIIVKERKDSYSYTFTIELNNLEAVLSDDGNVYISNTDGEVKYIIPAPVVYDADKVYAPEGASGYELTKAGNGKYELTVTVSTEWMNDEARAFPVTIDPPIEAARGSVIDLYIDKNAPTNTGTTFGDYLEVSATKTSYIKFPDSVLSSIPQGATVMQANLNIIGRSMSSVPIVGVYPVITSWNGLLTYNKTLSPSYEGKLGDNPLDYTIVDENDVRYNFDITEVYEGWVNGESNNGIALKLIDESTLARARFTSYDYSPGTTGDNFYEPVLLVTYIYNDGLESYFPTSTHSAGVGGAGSINLATGRLTLAIPTLTATDNLFGFTPTLVYNSSLAGKPLTNANAISPFSTSYLPYGFKLNLQEFIQRKSYIDSEGATQTYYALYDADGTTHTLLYSIGGVIRDDSGLGLTLAIDDSGNITITDKSHTKKTYTSYDSSSWYLTSVTDKFGNQLIFKFDSSNRPIKVVVKPNGMGEIDMLLFIYDGNKLISVYNDISKQAVILNYSGEYLSSVKYCYGNSSMVPQIIEEFYSNPAESGAITVYASANYTYNSSGQITAITDSSVNKSIRYEIADGKITKVSEYAGTTLGQENSYSYGKGYTDVRSTGNNELLGDSDDIITRYIFDDYGRAVSVYSSSADGNTIYAAATGVYETSQLAKNNFSEEYVVNTNESIQLGNYSAEITGGIDTTAQTGSYTINIFTEDGSSTYNADMQYQISGFGYSNSIIRNENAKFGISVKVYYKQANGEEDIIETYDYDFQEAEGAWQFVAGKIDCRKDDSRYNIVRKIDIVLYYYGQLDVNGQVPYALFDRVCYVDCSGFDTDKVTYDDETGNLKSKNDSYYNYNLQNNVIRIANNNGEIREFVYDDAGIVLLEETYYRFTRIDTTDESLLYVYPYEESDPDAFIRKAFINKTVYTYNAQGLLTSTMQYTGNSLEDLTDVSSSYTYDVTSGSKIFGAMLTSTDSLGHVTKYFYDSTNGNLLAEIDVESGDGYVYIYDEIGRLEKVTPASGSASSYSGVANAEEVEYTYDEALRLSKINTATTEYTFTYDIFGNSTSVSAGNNTLATYEYNSNNGKLKKINYGNGFSEEYVYNDIEKVAEVWYNYSDGSRIKAYSYEYNENGTLKKFTNHQNGEVIQYVYDYSGRFISSSEGKTSNSNYKNNYNVVYNELGQVETATNIIDYLVSTTSYNATISTIYGYNTDGSLKNESTTYGSNNVIVSEYYYDAFNRLVQSYSHSGNFTHRTNYSYYSENNNTSGLVNAYRSTVNGVTTGYTYAYDSKGNITRIVDPNNDVTVYTYDDLGQLISEVKGNTTKTYTYDNAGNITSIVTTTEIESLDPDPGFKPIIKAVLIPTITTTTQTLTYGNSQWGDLLTSYNGQTITYDGIGNPLSYYNGSSYTFTWEGRRLVGAVKGSNAMSFEYNDDGIRTSKTVNGVETTYYVNGGQIVAEKTGTRTIVYIYDATGSPIGMMYRTPSYAANTWDTFWYEKNLQGDIIAVYNASGTKVATYTYTDAWGNYTVSYSNGGGSTGAQYNPFRYRGYYYDTDLGMYYLQSRYYDAKICRFISADGYVSTSQGILGNNMFAYCGNNPVNMVDPTGEFSLTVILVCIAIGMVIGGTAGGIISYNSAKESGEEGDALLRSTIYGVGKGALIGGAVGGVAGLAGSLIATYGASSIAGTAAITGAITIAAKTTEVLSLQVKKSIADGDSGWQIANDCMNSIYVNGGTLLLPVKKKAMSTGALYICKWAAAGEIISAKSFLGSSGGKALAYGLAIWSWVETVDSILCKDPMHRANQRGYILQ